MTVSVPCWVRALISVVLVAWRAPSANGLCSSARHGLLIIERSHGEEVSPMAKGKSMQKEKKKPKKTKK
jgi:hypothetical protein